MKGRLSKSIPSTHKERLEMESRTGGSSICNLWVFPFLTFGTTAWGKPGKSLSATRRLTPAYAQCSSPSINSKWNSGVNPKDRPNFRRLFLPWRVSQRGKEWLWLTLGTQTQVAAIPGSCPHHVYTAVGRHHQGILSSVHSRFSPSTNKK